MKIANILFIIFILFGCATQNYYKNIRGDSNFQLAVEKCRAIKPVSVLMSFNFDACLQRYGWVRCSKEEYEESLKNNANKKNDMGVNTLENTLDLKENQYGLQEKPFFVADSKELPLRKKIKCGVSFTNETGSKILNFQLMKSYNDFPMSKLLNNIASASNIEYVQYREENGRGIITGKTRVLENEKYITYKDTMEIGERIDGGYVYYIFLLGTETPDIRKTIDSFRY